MNLTCLRRTNFHAQWPRGQPCASYPQTAKLLLLLRLKATANFGDSFLQLLRANFAFFNGYCGLTTFKKYFCILYSANFGECRLHSGRAINRSGHSFYLEVDKFSIGRHRGIGLSSFVVISTSGTTTATNSNQHRANRDNPIFNESFHKQRSYSTVSNLLQGNFFGYGTDIFVFARWK